MAALGLGILVPGLKDVLIAFLDRTFDLHLYNAPPKVGWLLLGGGIILLAVAFVGVDRVWNWLEHRTGMTGWNKAAVVVLQQTGFDSNQRDLRSDELPPKLAGRAIRTVRADLSPHLRRSPPDVDRALEDQSRIPDRLTGAKTGPGETQLAYCGIVQAPFQILAGYQLAAWPAVLNFDWDRQRQRWWSLDEGDGPDLLIALRSEPVPDGRTLAIAIEVSYSISTAAILQTIQTIGEIVRIGPVAPVLDVLTHNGQVQAIASAFRGALDEARERYGAGHDVHVFCAAPMSVGFALGRQISRTLDGPVTAYAYDVQSTPHYPWGLVVNARPSAHVVRI